MVILWVHSLFQVKFCSLLYMSLSGYYICCDKITTLKIFSLHSSIFISKTVGIFNPILLCSSPTLPICLFFRAFSVTKPEDLPQEGQL